jgi:hypothetical protein
MTWVAIWLSGLTLLYLVNFVAGLYQGRRIRELERRLKEIEEGG